MAAGAELTGSGRPRPPSWSGRDAVPSRRRQSPPIGWPLHHRAFGPLLAASPAFCIQAADYRGDVQPSASPVGIDVKVMDADRHPRTGIRLNGMRAIVASKCMGLGGVER